MHLTTSKDEMNQAEYELFKIKRKQFGRHSFDAKDVDM